MKYIYFLNWLRLLLSERSFCDIPAYFVILFDKLIKRTQCFTIILKKMHKSYRETTNQILVWAIPLTLEQPLYNFYIDTRESFQPIDIWKLNYSWPLAYESAFLSNYFTLIFTFGSTRIISFETYTFTHHYRLHILWIWAQNCIHCLFS